MLILPTYYWYGRQAGGAAYKTQVDQILAGLRKDTSAWPGFTEQFDQAYYHAFNAFAERAAF